MIRRPPRSTLDRSSAASDVYKRQLLKERGIGHVQVFGGGGGVIVPSEIKELMDYGVSRIFSPEDGATLGLQGMINHLLAACDFPTTGPSFTGELTQMAVGKLISWAENHPERASELELQLSPQLQQKTAPVIGMTGTGGAGKSSLTDELLLRFGRQFPDRNIAVVAMDPTRRRSGGALLGDRIRMPAEMAGDPGVFMRSMASRGSLGGIAAATGRPRE